MSGIYIHIPFCKSKCTYCDFTSFPKKNDKQAPYMACVYKEIKLRSQQLKGKTFSTIYFGGGTPSIIKPEYIAGAIKQIRKFYSLADDLEITIEINPCSIDSKKMAIYKSAGVNRFSVGLQSAQDYHLKRLNRTHSLQDFINALKLMQGENVSGDILIGLKQQTEQEIFSTIDILAEQNVSHISMYALTPEEGTPIFTSYLNGELPSNDETAEMYKNAVSYLKEKGFNRYEVSNFAKGECYSKHNLNYWNRGEYIGIGVAASSFMFNKRFTNTGNLDDYMKCIISNHYAVVDDEFITDSDAEFEYIMLKLRTESGINLKIFESLFKQDFTKKYAKVLAKQQNYLDITDSNIKIKADFIFVQNTIIVEFLTA